MKVMHASTLEYKLLLQLSFDPYHLCPVVQLSDWDEGSAYGASLH